MCGCGCCSALRPRYKRLVDNIFPENPEDGLVKSNMEKLTFYSLRSPEKLDRIGEYLFQKATKDINRRKYKLVEIAMEAMDGLLVACHAHNLNLFVESFLRMVQKLLEDSNPDLQIMASNSFVRFANIEEDTPSYHRRYDFFISKFSSMCHTNHTDPEMRDNLRLAGIKGIQGVIRKTVSDDLVENIWDGQHMEKIVPSLLFNMQSGPLITSSEEDTNLASTPASLAETVLRELVSRASFSHIRAVLKPLLTHMDRHDLWVPNKFAIQTFRIVMLSIQPQYSYTVVETLMSHLDQNAASLPRIKTSIAVVLSKIISIAAGESVGPSALDIINNLLNHLRISVKQSERAEASQYQEALINALGEFANHHPDYQKIEIMLFIINTIPDMSKSSKEDVMLKNILLKSLLRVGVQYRTTSYEKAFPASFLQPLMKMLRVPFGPARVIVMQIFQVLLDRHSNHKVLDVVSIGNYPQLSLELPSRIDIIFFQKYGTRMMQALIDGTSSDDDSDVTAATFKTSALMIVEMACTETIQEFLLFILGFQTIAITSTELTNTHKCNLFTTSIVLAKLLAKCAGITSLLEYVERIIKARQEEAPYFLPPLLDLNRSTQNTNINLPHLLLDKLALAECLQDAGIDGNRLLDESPYAMHETDLPEHRHSWVDTTRSSLTDGNFNYSNDNDSVGSSPGVIKKALPSDYNFESMKRMLAEPTERSKREAKDKEMQIVRAFREYGFDDLMRRTEPKHDVIQTRLNELFTSLGNERGYSQTDGKMTAVNAKAIYENNFPELFFY